MTKENLSCPELDCSSANESAYCYTFLRNVVCLSVDLFVCHIRVFCLNRSANLYAIWQAHHAVKSDGLCYYGVSEYPGKSTNFWDKSLAETCNCKLLLPRGK